MVDDETQTLEEGEERQRCMHIAETIAHSF